MYSGSRVTITDYDADHDTIKHNTEYTTTDAGGDLTRTYTDGTVVVLQGGGTPLAPPPPPPEPEPTPPPAGPAR